MNVNFSSSFLFFYFHSDYVLITRFSFHRTVISMAGDNQHFCLRWNNHQSTLISVFDTLLESGTLVDCTLAAEGQYLKAHKVVLSACSPYLEVNILFCSQLIVTYLLIVIDYYHNSHSKGFYFK